MAVLRILYSVMSLLCFHNKTKQLDSYVTFVTVFIVLKENANVSQLVQLLIVTM